MIATRWFVPLSDDVKTLLTFKIFKTTHKIPTVDYVEIMPLWRSAIHLYVVPVGDYEDDGWWKNSSLMRFDGFAKEKKIILYYVKYF